MTFILGILIVQWTVVLFILALDIIGARMERKKRELWEELFNTPYNLPTEFTPYYPTPKDFLLSMIPFFFIIVWIRAIIWHFKQE